MAIAALRLPAVKARFGRSRSSLYGDIKVGTFVPPVRLGPRCVGWPEHEVDQILAARIAGKSEDEIKALVKRLEASRKAA